MTFGWEGATDAVLFYKSQQIQLLFAINLEMIVRKQLAFSFYNTVSNARGQLNDFVGEKWPKN